MRFLLNAAWALTGLLVTAAIAFFAAAIWSSGDLSTRFGATGGLCIGVAVVVGFATALAEDFR